MNELFPRLLGHATFNYIVWVLCADYCEALQMLHVYMFLFCQVLTTVAHCCLVLLMMQHFTFGGYSTMQLE